MSDFIQRTPLPLEPFLFKGEKWVLGYQTAKDTLILAAIDDDYGFTKTKYCESPGVDIPMFDTPEEANAFYAWLRLEGYF